MPIRRLRTLIVLLVAAAACVALTWRIGSLLAAPVPGEVGPVPSTLLGATEVSFSSPSGSLIRAWLAPGRPGHGSVVLAHARGSDRRGMLGRAEFLQHAGYSVLLFDAQAHGESPGQRATFGHLEALDAAAAVDFVKARKPNAPIAFVGVSQGGAAALLGPSPLLVSALVLEAVYSTLAEAVANRLEIRLGEPGRWLAPLLLWQLVPRLGVSAEALAPIHEIRHIEAPLLLVAGEADRRAKLDQSLALYDAAPPPKELWIVPGAAHQDLHGFAPRAYERRILDFLDRALRPPP